jgi:hypothetical protein
VGPDTTRPHGPRSSPFRPRAITLRPRAGVDQTEICARWATVSPLHIVIGLIGGGVLWMAAGPVNDIDSYWHVMIGRQLLATRSPDRLGTQWLGVAAPPWHTSEWLSEVGMAELVSAGGWRALVVARLVAVAALLALVALALLHGTRPAVRVVAFGCAAVGILSVAQDRPQTLSMVFIALLSHACARLLRQGRRPAWPLVAGVALLWAQLHPLWVLAPAAFLLMAVAVATQDGLRHPTVRAALVCTVAALAGVVNPLGPSSLVLPLHFHDATAMISEWGPTTLSDPFTIAWGLLLLATFTAWARSAERVPRGEVLWVLSWTAFGLLAFRDVVPAVLLTIPVMAGAAERIWGPRLDRLTTPNGRLEGKVLRAVTVAAAGVGIIACGVQVASMDPLHRTPALHIARALAERPGITRVFNTYNASGSLIAFGGDRLRLVVDGRADLWGNTYITKIRDAQFLGPDWLSTFSGFRPDAAVIDANSPLGVLLVREGSWRVTQVDGVYALLEPAATTAR